MYFDIWRENLSNPGTIIPVETDVKAESPEQAVAIIAQETGIPVSQLQAFEASNPGYRANV